MRRDQKPLVRAPGLSHLKSGRLVLRLRLQPELDQTPYGLRLIRNWLLLCSPAIDGIDHVFRETNDLLYGVGFRSTYHFAYAN
jgi:hypothetical protein